MSASFLMLSLQVSLYCSSFSFVSLYVSNVYEYSSVLEFEKLAHLMKMTLSYYAFIDQPTPDKD